MSDFYCDEVLSGKTTVVKVQETAQVLAFHHTRPSYPVHIVVIPKIHIASLLELTDTSLMIEMLEVLQTVASEVMTLQGACRVVTNLGSYQDSKHLHWHVISGKQIEK